MAPRYGDFTFDTCHGFTGSAGKQRVKGYMRGGYAEGGMRSESTEEAKATRRVQDDAFAPSRQLNKSLKNLNRVRNETGYGADEEAQGFAKGGKFGMRKTRADKGKTQEVTTPKFGPGAGGPSMPGQIGPADTPMIQSPTPVAAPAIGGAMKMGGRAKRR